MAGLRLSQPILMVRNSNDQRACIIMDGGRKILAILGSSRTSNVFELES
jgi:hypothetical protein